MKKKRCKFDVELSVEELSSIPLLNGVLFAKVRLLHGGDFSSLTPRKEVRNHCVKWLSRFVFSCKLSASASSGILETTLCRVSVRKEIKGGKSFDKLGYADLNLAEFAGGGLVSKRFILDGYNVKSHRQDNSILKVTVGMKLTSGDPLFRPQVPLESSMLPATSESEANRATARDLSDVQLGGGSAGNANDNISRTMSDSLRNSYNMGGHSRAGSASLGSHHPRSNSHSHHSILPPVSHTRSSSLDASKRYTTGQSGSVHSRKSSNSSDSTHKDDHIGTFSPGKTVKRDDSVYRNIDDTRVNADDVIDQLINGEDFTADSSFTDEGNQLSLFIAKDGTASALAGYDIKRPNVRMQENDDYFKTL